MVSCHDISDADFDRIKDLLPGQPTDPGVTVCEQDNRFFLNVILFVAKTGIPWRDLPESMGNSNSVFQRYNRWSRKGVFQRIFEHLQDPDTEWLFLDSSVLRAHQHSAGAEKSGEQSIGRSVGGLNTKIHAGVDGLGNPQVLILTPGQEADVTQAKDLVESVLKPQVVIGDKGYDSKKLVARLLARGIEAQIPSRSNAKEPRVIDQHV